MQLSLYASLHFQTCDFLTVIISESARNSNFSPHVFLQFDHIESATSQLL